MAKISVLMGVYNCKSFEQLKRSVMSIVNQTYADWELIICNDGSNDITADYLSKISEIDNRIKIVGYKENKGLANALNYAMNFASGEYFARMDDDDISKSDRFYKEIDFLEKHKDFAFVGSNVNVFNKDGIWGVMKMPEYPSKYDLLWNMPFIHPTMMFRKTVFDNDNRYSTLKVDRRCEDYTLVMDLYSQGMKGYNFQETLLDYQCENGDKKYRPLKTRVEEAIVRVKGFRKNKMLFVGIPYIVKPLLIALIPQCVFKRIKQRQYSK